MKLIQITDTHLSPTKPHFNGNWEPLRRWIVEQAPDLIVHTGDLSIDGADHEADLAFAADLIRSLPAPVLSLPGNHDVGHFGTAQPIDDARLARWRHLVGPDRWVEDRGDWRLIGLDAMLFGAGDARELEQLDWFAEALDGRGGRRVATFSHKPLFVDAADEGETGYWGLKPVPRQALRALLAAHEVALFASGHLHVAWQGRLDDTSLVWAPASSFTVGPMERDMPGRRMLGAAVHHFGEGVTSTLVEIPGLSPYVLDDVVEEVYPESAPRRRAAS